MVNTITLARARTRIRTHARTHARAHKKRYIEGKITFTKVKKPVKSTFFDSKSRLKRKAKSAALQKCYFQTFRAILILTWYALPLDVVFVTTFNAVFDTF